MCVHLCITRSSSFYLGFSLQQDNTKESKLVGVKEDHMKIFSKLLIQGLGNLPA